MIVSLVGCGTCEPDPTTTITPEPLVELEPGQPSIEPAERPETELPEASEPSALERVIDPEGHARIRAHVVHGDRIFAIVQRDLVAAGKAELSAVTNHEVVERAFESVVGHCLGEDRGAIRCLAETSPNIALFLENVADQGSSWTVVTLENGRVLAHRSLVALSIHPPADDISFRASIHVEDVDGDSRVEVIVEVPVKPVRDDSLGEWGDDESGTVRYVLDETLSVQARWTASWSSTEGTDDGPSRSESCSVLSSFREDHALVLERECVDDSMETLVCPYDASQDRYTCPTGFADELFVNENGRYVGETVEELGLPMGTGFGPIPSNDRAVGRVQL